MTSKRTALITGASGGIGADLARVCAREGHDLVLVARSREPMEKLAAELAAAHGISARVETADLARPGAAAELAERLAQAGIRVDILINNAGFGSAGPFKDTPDAVSMEMIHLNVGALVQLTRLVLPGMAERRWGRILNIASTAAFVPGPFMAVYYATKAFVRSFSEALDAELAGTGITVTCACPGPVFSGFQARAGQEGIRMISGIMRAIVMTPEAVAEQSYRAMTAGRRFEAIGTYNKIMWLSSAITPRRVAAWYARMLNTGGSTRTES